VAAAASRGPLSPPLPRAPRTISLSPSPDVAQCGWVLTMALPAQGRSMAWKPLVLIFPLSLSPTVAAHGGRTRCGWASTVPRLVQTSLRCSCVILFCDFAFVFLISPYLDYESCSIIWLIMSAAPMFAFSVFIFGRMALIASCHLTITATKVM
jgi:hypothetical protein